MNETRLVGRLVYLVQQGRIPNEREVLYVHDDRAEAETEACEWSVAHGGRRVQVVRYAIGGAGQDAPTVVRQFHHGRTWPR